MVWMVRTVKYLLVLLYYSIAYTCIEPPCRLSRLSKALKWPHHHNRRPDSRASSEWKEETRV
jgi:hypothetical protein